MASLVRGVTSGTPPVVARYYTLIPYEDDSRQRAFLDAVARAGMQVIVKRLPPKGITRQVSVDPEMAADILAFSMGHQKFSSLSEYRADDSHGANDAQRGNNNHHSYDRGSEGTKAVGFFPPGSTQAKLRAHEHKDPVVTSTVALRAPSPESKNLSSPSAEISASPETASGATPNGAESAAKGPIHRVVTVVCPGRDLAYALALSGELGADTVSADFGQFNAGDVLKSAAKWIDLSDSETIWRDS
jgi:hypothetical protein